jgi:hypothetical protein
VVAGVGGGVQCWRGMGVRAAEMHQRLACSSLVLGQWGRRGELWVGKGREDRACKSLQGLMLLKKTRGCLCWMGQMVAGRVLRSSKRSSSSGGLLYSGLHSRAGLPSNYSSSKIQEQTEVGWCQLCGMWGRYGVCLTELLCNRCLGGLRQQGAAAKGPTAAVLAIPNRQVDPREVLYSPRGGRCVDLSIHINGYGLKGCCHTAGPTAGGRLLRVVLLLLCAK